MRTFEEGLVDKLAVLLGDKHAELSVTENNRVRVRTGSSFFLYDG